LGTFRYFRKTESPAWFQTGFQNKRGSVGGLFGIAQCGMAGLFGTAQYGMAAKRDYTKASAATWKTFSRCAQSPDLGANPRAK
jgi:hypothetical protein